jgi:UDP-3-O-[3-hydroxymyristoyl] glucosamine N-acyltransferase
VISLGELAVRFGCGLRGDPDLLVGSVASLIEARPGTVAFLAHSRFRPALASTRASAVVVDEGALEGCPVAALIAKNPHATFARIATLLHPAVEFVPGVHPSAILGPDVRIDPSAHVGPLCVIGARAIIGARTYIGAGSILEPDVELGEDVRLIARVTLGARVQIGPRTLVQPGAVIGADGFGFANERGRWIKVPQLGTVRVGADVEIGCNTTIDRGALGDTVIGEGAKLDNQIQIGHNVRIGAHTAMAACTGISGSTTIGERCMIGGSVGVNGHIDICDDVVITGFSMVSHSIREPGVYSGGLPFEKATEWRRVVARFKRLDSLARRLEALERASPDLTARMSEASDLPGEQADRQRPTDSGDAADE